MLAIFEWSGRESDARLSAPDAAHRIVTVTPWKAALEVPARQSTTRGILVPGSLIAWQEGRLPLIRLKSFKRDAA